MAYVQTEWVAGVTPLSEANMDHLETQYDEAIADAGIHTKVRKTADETVNNSTVLQNDDDLLFAIGANEVWAFELYCYCYPRAASDFKVAFTAPVGATGEFTVSTATAPTSTAIGGTARSQVDCVNGVAHLFIYWGIVINGANAGNLQFQWAQDAAIAEDTVVKENSCIIAHKLA